MSGGKCDTGGKDAQWSKAAEIAVSSPEATAAQATLGEANLTFTSDSLCLQPITLVQRSRTVREDSYDGAAECRGPGRREPR